MFNVYLYLVGENQIQDFKCKSLKLKNTQTDAFYTLNEQGKSRATFAGDYNHLTLVTSSSTLEYSSDTQIVLSQDNNIIFVIVK